MGDTPVRPTVVAPVVVVAPPNTDTPLKSAINVAGRDVATPTTTAEEDRATAGQRGINLKWEDTQRQIALVVVFVAVATASYLSVMGSPEQRSAAFVFLTNMGMLIGNSYFQRTNHTRTGGITAKGDR